MTISDEEIAEFKAIWKKEFGEEISDEKARVRGRELIEFCKLLLEHKRKELTEAEKASVKKSA